jgi:hypothetical protein
MSILSKQPMNKRVNCSGTPTIAPMYVDDSQKGGFTPYAELWNGRMAMIGFAALIIIELVTGKGLLEFFQIR